MEERQGLIKNLNKIYKNGYVPSRGTKAYDKISTLTVNCYGHACFNLTDKNLAELAPYGSELKAYFRNFASTFTGAFNEAVRRIRDVGLIVERSNLSEELKENQWRFAYYYKDDEFTGRDLHFMIQEKDGKWASKMGTSPNVEVFDKLPEYFHGEYELMGVYKVTNPYVKLEDEENMEM